MVSPATRAELARILASPPPEPGPGQLTVPTGPRIGSLCTGYGGLDEAARHVFGGSLAWVADLDPGPRRILAHHWPDVPNLGDLTAVDWTAVEPVDVLTAGYPCQPFSVAGHRKGTADERHIWPHIAAAIRVLRPRVCLFENVAGHVRLGLADVLADLAALGFDAEWTTVRASDVGAAHQRERLFILAQPADAASERGGEGRAEPAWFKGRLDAFGSDRAASDAARPRLEGGRPQPAGCRPEPRRHDPADAHGGRFPGLPERHREPDRAEADDEHRQPHPVGRGIPHADAADHGRQRGGAARHRRP